MLGIIIINYNTFEKTIECIESIRNSISTDYHIYLIDNNSNNLSQDILENKYLHDLDITFIKSKDNLGYARANNLCIKKAIADGCKYAIISNNDIIYKENAIDIMLSTIEKNSSAFIVGPKVLKMDGNIQSTVKDKCPTFFEYIINETYIRNFFKKKHPKVETDVDNNILREVYWVCGCCFITELCKFEQINFFDEYTFLFFEEYIVAEKAKVAGLTLLYQPEAQVLHFHGASMGGSLNILTRIENLKSETYFFHNYFKYGDMKMKLIWVVRLAEVAFNYRKEKNKTPLSDYYKQGKEIVRRKSKEQFIQR